MEGGPFKGEEAYSGWRVDPSKGRRHIVGGGWTLQRGGGI